MLPSDSNLTNQLLSALGEGVYGVDADGLCTFINPTALTLLGYEEHEVINQNQHLLFHHHKPNGEGYAHQDCPIYQTLKDGQCRHIDETFVHKNGQFVPVRLTVTPIQEENAVSGAVVAFYDISDIVKAQAEMRAERDLFAEGPVSVLVWELTENWPIRYASTNVSTLLGYTPLQMIDASFRYANCIHPEDLTKTSEEVRYYLLENRSRWEQHYRILHPDGQVRYIHDYTIAERDTTGKIVQLHGYLIDETRQKTLEQALMEMATTDALTGLANRRHLMKELEAECARFRRMGNAISVLMLDLDHFKRINDTWGHAAGDTVLHHFAESLRTLVRKTDIVGRLGGEEFVIVLPETLSCGAHVFAEKIRNAINQAMVTIEDTEISYTVSIGIASCTDRRSEDADSILLKADQALYQAKAEGRNRVVSINLCDSTGKSK